MEQPQLTAKERAYYARLAAIEILRNTLNTDSTIYLILRSTSRTKTYHKVSVKVVLDNKIRDISELVGRTLREPVSIERVRIANNKVDLMVALRLSNALSMKGSNYQLNQEWL